MRHYTDQHMHFNTLVTSRVEGNHALLKKQLHKGKKTSIDEVIQACAFHIQHQYSQLELRDRNDAVKIPVSIAQDTFFENVKGLISSTALMKTQPKLAEARSILLTSPDGSTLKPCSGVFTRTMGLPCVHQCISAIREERKLSVEMFASRWRLRLLAKGIPAAGIPYPRAPALPPKQLNQHNISAASRNKLKGIASTGRILSTFERESFA